MRILNLSCYAAIGAVSAFYGLTFFQSLVLIVLSGLASVTAVRRFQHD